MTGKYRTIVGSNVPRGYAISRADAAHAMLAVLDHPATLGQAVGMAYSPSRVRPGHHWGRCGRAPAAEG
jgi:hypothetical protein